jgi:Adenylate and Guanylate cyclase catalytic domain
MASKIEGSGQPGRIHISKETATQLKDHGKEHWLEPREDKIMTTKGELQTFWLLDSAQARLKASGSRPALQMHHSLSSELSDDSVGDISDWESRGSKPGQAINGKDGDSEDEANSKMMRLVAWNCEVMIPLLKMIKSRRAAENMKRMNTNRSRGNVVKQLEETIGSHNNVLDEVEEVISLPRYDAQVQKKIKSDPEKVRLGPKVEDELREYVLMLLAHRTPAPGKHPP